MLHQEMEDPRLTLDVLKLEYDALRKEICQSIDKQHQILLAGYGLVAALFGYAYGRPAPGSASQAQWAVLAVVPFAFLAMSALWTVECNRMVRASYYIGYYLWKEIRNVGRASPEVGWEAWIRSDDLESVEYGRTQDHMQRIVVLWAPILVSGLSVILAVEAMPSERRPYVFFASGAINMAWLWMVGRVVNVSNLRAVRKDGSMACERTAEDPQMRVSGGDRAH